ncbi:MAG: dihydrolipoamide acetyltransferase family protein, partial [Gemmatimonadota bacterium]
MATKVHMEALSPTMEEGQLVKWLMSEGDAVKDGDVLAEIETDKATMELVARGAGVLRKIFIEEGATAPVGEVIAVIAEEDEDISEIEGAAGGGGAAAAEEPAADEDAEEPAAAGADDAEDDEVADKKESGERKPGKAEADAEPRAEGKPDAAAKAAPAAQPAREPSPEKDGGRVKASPLARRLAEEKGVELSGIEGSGPGGRIVKADVEGAEAGSKKAAAPAAAAPAYARGGPETEEVPVSQMRKAIAKRLVQSIGPVPTFYLTVDVDMTAVTEARERVNAYLEQFGQKASINDFILKATALALKKHPEVNAAWQEDVIVRHHRVHLGVAVAIDEGLITPVIRDADLKGVGQIGAEVREMAGRAREKKLKPEEYTGATFSVSNLGMFGIE